MLDAPGSRYHYRCWPPVDTAYIGRYVEEGLLPPANEFRGDQSPILLVANHGHGKVRAEDHSVGVEAVMQAYTHAHNFRHKKSFHTYGPTRMLMWMSDSDKRTLLPRTVAYRSKVAVSLELSMHVEEIVGGPPLETKARREDALEIRSGERAAERTKEEGLILPPRRQLAYEGTFGRSSAGTTRDWHRELRELEEGFKTLKYSQFEGELPKPLIDARGRKQPARKGVPFSPEYKRFQRLKGIFNRANVNHNKADKYVQMQEEIDRLDLEAHRKDINTEQRKELLRVLDAKIRDFKASLEDLREADLQKIMFLDDDRRAFAMDPPLLMWDRRKAEPILAENDEFYHISKPMALLDFQPQPKSIKDFPMNEKQEDYFDDIATHLMSVRGPATLHHLNKLAPGAFEALTSKVPALRDPRKGGRRDIDFVRNRTLTPEMFHGLALAWDQWLFKPADPRTYPSIHN